MGKSLKKVLSLVLTIVIIVSFLLIPISKAIEISSQNNTKTPIKHVIDIMFENHSFDNLFGIYPNNGSSSQSNIIQSIQRPLNLLDTHNISMLKAVPPGQFNTADPVEGYSAYHLDWNNGKMNGFYNNSGPQSMTYFTAAQMAPEWDLAMQYGLGDMYFSSQLSESNPNRLYNLAGFSPVINDYGPPPYIPLDQSIFYELNKYNVSWAYYVNNTSLGIGTLNYFNGIGKYSSNIQNWSNFFGELANNTLPSVTWLMPVDGGARSYSQGPPDNILKGEMWLLYVVDSVMKSPEWNSTAIFITYDEAGGYYDQVSPPTLDGVQLGVRVPLMVISPFTKENYVSNTVLNHASILAFMDYNWNLPALNRFVADSNIPIDFFYFNKTSSNDYYGRQPLLFSNALGFPVPGSPIIGDSQLGTYSNLSSLFPMKPQLPFNNLPYERSGSSNVTLSNLNSGIFVKDPHQILQFYETNWFLALILVAIGATAFYAGYQRKTRK